MFGEHNIYFVVILLHIVHNIMQHNTKLISVLAHREGQPYSEEVRNVAKSALTAALVGLVYGGLPGARHARERFIQLSQAEIYRSRVEAVVKEPHKRRD